MKETKLGGLTVLVEDGNVIYPLNPRYDLANHSPTGFAWGYGGSGPAQLSLALLADALSDDERALHLYQRFKFRVVAGLPQHEPWTLLQETILHAVMSIDDTLKKSE